MGEADTLVSIWTIELWYQTLLPGSPVVEPGRLVFVGELTGEKLAAHLRALAKDIPYTLFRDQVLVLAGLAERADPGVFDQGAEIQGAGASGEWYRATAGEPAIGTVYWRKLPLRLVVNRQEGLSI